jgi:phosphoglycolate phosphatase-like HAD superfamily hydrolase
MSGAVRACHIVFMLTETAHREARVARPDTTESDVHADSPLGFVPLLVMFDLDGTLIDTMQHFADLASELIAEHHGMDQVSARRRYLETSGIPLRQQLEVIFPGDPRNDQVSEIYEERKTSICLRATMPQETISALERLGREGVRVVLSSNSAQHFVDELAARCPVRFDLVLGFGGGLAKGETHVAEVQRRLGIAPEQILFVGDSLKDGELAERCGQRFVGVSGTFAAEDFQRRFGAEQLVVQRIAELPTLIFGR